MLEIPPSALLLAGFTLAHAAWSVSDTKPDELLVPLAIVENDGKRTLQRFEAATQLEAINAGKAASEKFSATSEAWAFAREGALREPHASDTVDAISVSFWARGMPQPAIVIQRFERATAAHGFRVVGAPVISVGGKAVGHAEAQPYVDTLMRGVMSHSKVAPLWPTWK